MIINSNGVNAGHTDEEINEIIKEKMLVEKYWWKRQKVVSRGFKLKLISTTEESYQTDGSSYVASEYVIDPDTGNLSVPKTFELSNKYLVGYYKLLNNRSIEQFVSRNEMGSKLTYYTVKTYEVYFEEIYSNTEYIQSYNKNEYPTDDGAELDNYEYHYLGCPLTKAVLIDNTSDADNIALTIQNAYDITLLQLGITEE